MSAQNVNTMSAFLKQLSLEFAAIFRDPAVAITVIAGVLFYAVLYPQPYLKQSPRDQSIAVIDQDNSHTSRRLIRWVNATPQVTVNVRVDSIAAARTLLINGDIHGFLHIPAHFERNLALSKSPVVSLAGDANYFLIYGTVIEGLEGVIVTLGAEFRIQERVQAGLPLTFAKSDWSPLKLNQRPLFNTSMGYLGYVIPAIFILILHQTLLLASGLIGAKSRNTVYQASAGVVLSARFFAMFSVYFLLAQFYMGACFSWYGISRLASLQDLLFMITAFIASTVSLGILIGLLLPRRELAAPLVMVSSLPLVFTAGFVWPLESIPPPVLWISDIFPSTAAIQGFLKLNQMGADFNLVLNHWWWMWGLCVFYTLFAYHLLSTRANKLHLGSHVT